MTRLSPIPTRERCEAEDAAAQLLVGHCGNCPHISAQNIPFRLEWLEQARAAESLQITAAAIVFRSSGMDETQATANWLKQLAHEIEGLVLQEQIQRTRRLADEQSRLHALKHHAKRIAVDANLMAAIEALEELETKGEKP